jgi:hypothetical protein
MERNNMQTTTVNSLTVNSQSYNIPELEKRFWNLYLSLKPAISELHYDKSHYYVVAHTSKRKAKEFLEATWELVCAYVQKDKMRRVRGLGDDRMESQENAHFRSDQPMLTCTISWFSIMNGELDYVELSDYASVYVESNGEVEIRIPI